MIIQHLFQCYKQYHQVILYHFARVPWNEPGIIMKMLDAGVYGIISPMINTKEDCEKFVSYCMYPPLGQRSFGPTRAMMYAGEDYYNFANEEIIKLAMIETKKWCRKLRCNIICKKLRWYLYRSS